MTISPEREAWAARAKAKAIVEVARALGIPFKKDNAGMPCPFCLDGTDRFSITKHKGGTSFCRVCGPRDALQLVMDLKSYDFTQACEWMLNEPPPGQGPSEKVAATRDVAPDLPDAPSREEQEASDNRRRDAQIKIANGIWGDAGSFAGTLAEDYLRARGIDRLPDEYELRFAPMQSYWHQAKGETERRVLYRGPVLIGKITDPAGAITACHITWIDRDRPGKKMRIANPDFDAAKDKPNKQFLDAKKLRGSKRKAWELITLPVGCWRMVMGEGRETVLSAWLAEQALAPALCRGTAYVSAVDLGHMAGASAEYVRHPTAKRKDGVVLKVPGPVPRAQPDRDLAIPDTITSLLLLGDGDSEPFATEMALRRSAARYAREGRTIAPAWAPPGIDFNNVLLGEEAAPAEAQPAMEVA